MTQKPCTHRRVALVFRVMPFHTRERTLQHDSVGDARSVNLVAVLDLLERAPPVVYVQLEYRRHMGRELPRLQLALQFACACATALRLTVFSIRSCAPRMTVVHNQ